MLWDYTGVRKQPTQGTQAQLKCKSTARRQKVYQKKGQEKSRERKIMFHRKKKKEQSCPMLQ